ncbi:class I SAM-dependent methyltransferase [Robertkochia aurantiaca]|uniref:class I SAM-dependent methyltransferase n=1 Tax=Robertkochia aurantiaca TaxID=2873700 RepID=UPI001CCFA9A4|nr:class I SAM-dependent methyltransferase [Robertkochia sp. 3YJGBD-33]
MKPNERKEHWEEVFQTKDTTRVSWYEALPEKSMALIENTGIAKNASILDVGGGDSRLVDHLINKGYTDITLLDISETALKRVRERLGDKITYLRADSSEFTTEKRFMVWHDRASFHFLTDDDAITAYRDGATAHILPGGYLILGTFGVNGPEKCSGLTIRRYGPEQLFSLFQENFSPLSEEVVKHQTPSGSLQEFTFVVMKRKA